MTSIDYERLLIILKNDVHESEHQNFDLEGIVKKARLSDDESQIIVESSMFRFTYDSITYEQCQYGNAGGSPTGDDIPLEE